MKAGPALITDLICEELTLDQKPTKLARLIEQVIKEHFPELDPVEKASEWEVQVGSRLLKYIKAAEERGIQPKIAFNSSSSLVSH